MDKLKMETPDLFQANIEKLAALFPACVTEARGEDGKLKKAVNFDLLRQLLSDVVLEGDETYEFTWVGKKAAIVEAPSGRRSGPARRRAWTGTPPKTSTSRATTWKCSNCCRRAIWAR